MSIQAVRATTEVVIAPIHVEVLRQGLEATGRYYAGCVLDIAKHQCEGDHDLETYGRWLKQIESLSLWLECDDRADLRRSIEARSAQLIEVSVLREAASDAAGYFADRYAEGMGTEISSGTNHFDNWTERHAALELAEISLEVWQRVDLKTADLPETDCVKVVIRTGGVS